MRIESRDFIDILIKDYPGQPKGQIINGRIRRQDLLEVREDKDSVKINAQGEIREFSKNVFYREFQGDEIQLGCEPDSYLEYLSNDIGDYRARHIMRVISLALQN